MVASNPNNQQTDRQPPGRPEGEHGMRIYTRRGDQGETRLAGGQAVRKDDPRLEAYGTVDELQVAVGGALDAINELGRAGAAGQWGDLELLGPQLTYLQNRLFTLGSELATRQEDRGAPTPTIRAADVTGLEEVIDAYSTLVPPLKNFVLPTGHRLVTALHQCRVVCRRAERAAERLARHEAVGEQVMPYLNRLSDAFFILARFAHHRLAAAGLASAESVWIKTLEPPPLPPGGS